MKKLRIISAAAAAAVLLSGCSISVGTNRDTRISSIQGVKDDEVVATPLGTGSGESDMDISYLDFKKEYLYYLDSYGITDDTDESTASTCTEQRATIINYLINEKIILDQADKMGIGTLSEEETAALNEEFDALVDEQIAYFGENADYGTLATGEVISDDEMQERGGELFDEFLAQSGLTRDDLYMWQVSAAITEKVQDEVTKDVSVDRDEAQAQYDAYVDSVKALYEDDVEEYENGSYYVFWIPEGSRRIKHILLAFDDTVSDEITLLRESDGDEAAEEYRAEQAELLQSELDEVMELIEDGSDFDELIETYSADSTGSSYYPDGYLVVPNGVTFMTEFQTAAFELENVGDITTCVTDYGVHIMLYASEAYVPQENIDSYVDYLYEVMTENEKTTVFSEKLSEWKQEYDYQISYDLLAIEESSDTAESSAEAS